MRYVMPILVLSFFAGVAAIYEHQSTVMLRSSQDQQAEYAGQTFIAYASAVAAFVNKNPSFTGTISVAQLDGGDRFSQQFLATAGNSVTSFGTSGRTVMSYAKLPFGALNSIASLTGGDASYGVSSGSAWISIAVGAREQPLNTAVPQGSTVAIFQVGQ